MAKIHLNRFRVTTRIYAGFGCLIALGLAIAVCGLWQLQRAENDTNTLSTLNQQAASVLNGRRDTETMQRATLQYKALNDKAAIGQFEEAYRNVAELLKTAQRLTPSEERKRSYTLQLQMAETLNAEFGRLVQFADTVESTTRALSASGVALAASTNAIRQAAQRGTDAGAIDASRELETAMLTLRVASLRFTLFKTAQTVENFHATRDAVARSLAELAPRLRSTDLQAALATLQSSFVAYLNAFDTQAVATIAGEELFGTMIPQLATLSAEQERTNAAMAQYVAATQQASIVALASARLLQLGFAGGALLLGIGLAALIARGIATPLRAMTRAMRKLADGDTGITVPGRDGKDEIAAMADAVEIFRRNAIESERLVAEREAARAAIDRRQAAIDRHTQDFGSSISGVMSGLAAAAEAMQNAAKVMADAAGGVHSEATATAGTAAQSSQDLVSVAAAIEQLTASVDEISRQIAAAAEVSRQAVQRAETGQSSIRGLADSTSRIGDVVRLISDIAGQTNLLALNATIEAARAGEAGRGFAVVAGEVKALAAQTAKATAEIGHQIETVRDATEQTVTAMSEVSNIIGKMDAVTAAISAAVEEQSTSTRGIAASIQDVARATAGSVRAMESVVTVAEGAGVASRDVSAGAIGIGQQAETLRTEVDQFLAAVKDSGDRRRYERIHTNGATAGLRTAGRDPVRVALRDLSRGGAALTCDWPLTPGTAVTVDLPEAGGEVAARVVRRDAAGLAVVFSSEVAALARIDRVLDALAQIARAA